MGRAEVILLDTPVWERWLAPESRSLRAHHDLTEQAFSRAVAIVAYQRGTPGIAFTVARAKARLLFECGREAEGCSPAATARSRKACRLRPARTFVTAPRTMSQPPLPRSELASTSLNARLARGALFVGFMLLVVPTVTDLARPVWATDEQGHGPIIAAVSFG